MQSRLISLSGIDGSGKSTQINLIEKALKLENKKVIKLWTRGGNTPGINFVKDLARKILGNKLPPSGHSKKRDEMLTIGWIQKLWLFIGIIDLIRIYGINIRIHLLLGKSVICDRFLWDTLIDFKIMFPKIEVDRWIVWKILVLLTPTPHKSILLTIPEDVSEKRCSEKYEPFPDTPERRKTRYEMYKKAAKRDYWVEIDALRPIDEVYADIINV